VRLSISRSALILAAFCATVGCSTLNVREDLHTRIGSPAGGLAVVLAQSPTGTVSVQINGDSIKGATVVGTAQQISDGWKLSLAEVRWFNNWPNGWTEARFAATGVLQLRQNGLDWTLSVVAPPQLGDATAASIRRNDDYATGERGLKAFSNRWARIRVTVTLLEQKLSKQWFDYATTPSQGRAKQSESFENAAGIFLFPELYGHDTLQSGEHRTVRAESINWNLDYTDANFPDSLREVRNSGSMLRDFEECIDLWRLAFCWNELWNHRIEEATFVPMK
jgi:hypothetical protein